MAKQVNISLGFKADITEVQRAIEELNQSLRKIQTKPAKVFDDLELKKASQAALDLEKHLRAAVNVNTGKLDLNKFSQSLAASKQNLSDLYKDLNRAGEDGQAAFLNLAKSINNADSSTLNLGSKLKDLGKTLKNTARWEISSKIMHGFESAISTAYGYAQDLNRSLNDIRIVTGQNIDQMAQFAEQANKAAKALSTSTTTYTDASLIYYQQGLSEAEVAERSAVTIKMANAAGVSAQTVSDQLTAVWNNFDDGSKSLEYYADVMTALGAATASSTDEISEGLNKFAAVAETVGLSYEYATAALATVTSTTRESADIVGNAYKTLFARIQGLQLGETLDDGTTLNKYSEALQSIGISIKDANGNMKDMDVILDEMGNKWKTLAKDQQIALAQTVAGVRQYNQLTALMDNWETFQENLDVAYNAEGVLNEQAEIYAESWDAASERVRAAAEGIYQELLNDEFFIDIFNGFELFLTGINNVIEGVGGLKTILLTVGGIFLKQYAKELPQAFASLRNNLDVITGEAEEKKKKILQDNAEAVAAVKVSSIDNKVLQGEYTTLQKVSDMTNKLAQSKHLLSEAEIKVYEDRIKNVEMYGKTANAIGEEVVAIERLIKVRERAATKEALKSGRKKALSDLDISIKNVDEKIAENRSKRKVVDAAREEAILDYDTSPEEQKKAAQKRLEQVQKNSRQVEEEWKRLQSQKANLIKRRKKSTQMSEEDIDEKFSQLKEKTQSRESFSSAHSNIYKQVKAWSAFADAIDKSEDGVSELKKTMRDYVQDLHSKGIFDDDQVKAYTSAIDKAKGSAQDVINAFWDLKKKDPFKSYKESVEALDDEIAELTQELNDVGINTDTLTQLNDLYVEGALTAEEYEAVLARIKKESSEIPTHTMELSEAYGVMASTLMEVWGAVEAIKSLGSIWSDEDLSTGEKLFQTMSALIPVIVSLSGAFGKQSKSQLAHAAASISQAIGLKTVAASEVIAAGATNTLNVSLGTLWSLLWPLALILAGVALAVWGLIEAFKAAKAASPEGQLEAAKEKSQELKTALEDAKAAAEELNSAFDSYDSAVEALENCTKGTQEWRDALQNVNNEVLNLLSKYPELASMIDPETGKKVIDYDENGELTVSDYGREYLEGQSNKRVMTANAASVAANQQVREAQIKIDERALATQLNKISGTTASKTDNEGNTVDYSSMVANYISKNAKALSGMAPDKQAEFIQSYLDSNGIAADTEAWVNAITELGPEFGSLINSIDANTAATKAENQVIATNALLADDAIQDSKYVNDIIATSGDIYDQLYKSKMQDLENEGWGTKGIAQINGANAKAKEIWGQYLEAAGLSAKDNYLVDTTGNDNNRQFVYGADKKVITLEAMREIVASAQAIEALGGSAREVATVFSQLSTSGDNADKVLQGLIADENLSGATKTESEALKKAINDAGGIEAYLGAKLGGDNNILEDEEAKAWGYDSAQKMIEALGAAVEGSDAEWASVGDSLIGSVKTAFENSLSSGMFDDLSLEQTNQMEDLFKSVFENAGSEGVTELQDTLSTLFSASGEDADKLASILGNIDWQITNVNELSQMLEEAGIETDGLSDELAKLIKLMKEGQNVGFDAAAKHYSSLQEFADLEEGESITEEERQILEAAGIDTSKYFEIMRDGSYQLRNDAEEFYRILNERSLDVFKSNIESMYDTLENVHGIMGTYDGDSINDASLAHKVDYLSALGVQDDNLASYQQMSPEELVQYQEEINRLMEENAGRWDELPAKVQAYVGELDKSREALANGATSIEELNTYFDQGLITIDQYNNAVDNAMEAEFEMEGLDPDTAMEIADAFRELGGVLENDEEAVKDATVSYIEFNEALEDIYDNYDDYVDVLKDAKKAITVTDKAAVISNKNYKQLRTSLAKLIGTSEDFIDIDFVAALDPKDFEAAANGDVEAIQRIVDSFIDAQAGLYNLTDEAAVFKDMMATLDDGAYIDIDESPFLQALIAAKVAAGASAAEIEAMLSGFQIHADVVPFSEEVWNAVQTARDGGQEIVNATSFTTEVEQQEVDSSRQTEVPEYREVATAQTRVMGWNYVPLGNGFSAATFPSIITTTAKSVDTSSTPQTFTETQVATSQTTSNEAGAKGKGGVIVKNAHKAPGASRTPSPGNTGRPPVTGGGGGGSAKEPAKPKKIDTTKEADVVERYKEVTDALDNVADSMNKVQMEADVLWGKNHINNLKEQNKLLDQQIDLLEREYEEARAYQAQDRADLEEAAADLGLSLTFDPTSGDVLDIEEAERAMYAQLAEAEAHYNSLTTGEDQDAYEEAVLDPLRKKIEAYQDAKDLYYESIETAEDAEIAKREAELQKMANNFQIWSEGLEIEIEFNDKDLEMLEFWISRLEDNVYEMAEAAALMVGKMDDLASGVFGGQAAEYIDNLHKADAALADLEQKFADGKITEVAYHEGLTAIREQYMSNIESLQDLDQTMMEYYENTLSAAQDELSKYTDQMEHQTSVLEYYQSLLELMGKSSNYKMLGKVLEGQAETTKNQAEVSRQWYESRKADADELRRQYEEAVAAGSSPEELELLKANWQAAEVAANEAQDQMLSDAEAWAEALAALLENKLNDLGQTLENQLTGDWGSFDAMTTAMERANSLQEEYLTTTNQIYETNKLMRTAQQEIDKSTNSVAKKRLQAFINETQQLQDQSKLSQYELEIQQAKYNLLLAEIALEEAQDAKSTVRLQRDSEGNFGYVYTADSNKINQAQQELEDAQNDLYNIGLEGANEYTEKYQQTMAEMYDTLRDLQSQYQEGAFESEAEYQQAVTEATDYYYQKLKDFSSLYSVALTTDSRVIADAWSTDFADMTYQTEQWMNHVQEYNNQVIDAFREWENAVTGPGGVSEIVGDSLEEVADNVTDITDKSKELAETTSEEVIPALNEEIDTVANLTGKYAKLRDTINEIIEQYGLMIEKINGDEQDDYYSPNNDDSGNPEDTNNPTTESPTGEENDRDTNTPPNTPTDRLRIDDFENGVQVKETATHFSSKSRNLEMDSWVPGSEFKVYSIDGNEILIGDPKRKGTYTGWVNISDVVALKSGGYTGQWGSYGKLAMLHEKELVLNAQDTSNLLTSVEVLERILQMIDLQSASSQFGGQLHSPGVRDTSSIIEQSVHIEASFPGVQDRNEIEEAFNNLINKASQYANRK